MSGVQMTSPRCGVDFYQSDWLWGDGHALLHCRRRLWQCGFAVQERSEEPGADDSGPPALVVEALLPEFPLGPEAEALLADEWRASLVEELMEAAGCSELEVGPWLPDAEPAEDGAGGPRRRSREVHARVQCPPSAFSPTSTRLSPLRSSVRVCVSVVREGVDDVRSIRFSSCWQLHDVPYGGCFRVHDAHTLEPAEGGVRFAKTVRVAFLEPTALRSMIERSTVERAKALGPTLVEIMNQRASGGPSTRVVEVWELQRRRTLFHDTWEAPFLPHDGQLQLRWVGADYQRHAWTPGTLAQEDCAGSSTPPLVAPEGWAALDAAWSVVECPGQEPEGWQYAVDFYRGGDLWGSQPALCHCRRRLWRREFALQSR
ncbi:unnamed protein product [Prorocentrum cordatum]|uniref:VASt domain-containing protein n=1 Tax=Prorocentrum cordatum TaxID=2364126 RepID=A0ABN9TH22_9DINO|nr:unnamed protein product [Polarella glacialis]